MTTHSADARIPTQYNPFIPEVHANPYPMYVRLRAEDPIQWSELMLSLIHI